MPQNILCVRVTGSVDAVRALLARHPTEAYNLERGENGVSLELFLPTETVAEIDAKALRVETLFDATERGRERQKEIGRGNRFKEGEHRTFQGLGTKVRGEPR